VAGTTHPLARAEFDVGPVSSSLKMDRMLLVLSPGPQRESELQAFLDSQQDKSSPNYHHWLTPEEFGQKFGPSPDDVQTVKTWLKRQGFTVNSTARSGRWIEFSGSSAQVQTAFRTQLRQYLVKGNLHMANATEISVPAALAPMVRGVTLHDFFKKPMLSRFGEIKPNPQGGYSYVDPEFNSSKGLHAMGPADFAKIYDLPALINGNGQAIAIVARGNISLADVSNFQSVFLLPSHSPTVVVNGTDPGFDPNNGDSVEATLDTEWSGAVAQQAPINVVVSSSTATTDGVDLSAAFIVDNDLSPIVSTSFGQCESLLGAAENAFWESLWQQAAAQGISAFVSAGDDGAAACDDPGAGVSGTGQAVSGLASTPFNTAVGGTQFNDTASPATFWAPTNGVGLESALGYIPEVVWNESCTAGIGGCTQTNLFAGSGGQSLLYAKPSWQQTPLGVTTPADGARDLPDVSLSAAGHDPYLICLGGSCDPTNPNGVSFFGVGGTSASSPSFAGIMAIILSGTGAGRQGLANYQLYKIASTENFANCNSSSRTNPATATTCVFNDTTSGNNSVPGVAGFNAVTGYDQATGLGSVDVNNLVKAWPTSLPGTTTALSSTNSNSGVTHGAAVSLSISVNNTTASGPSPTGVVALKTSASTGTIAPPVNVGALPLTASTTSNKATFSGNVFGLPGGQYSLSVHYPGDAVDGQSDSGTILVNIAPENSSTTVSSFGVDANGFAVPATSFPYGNFMDLHADIGAVSGQGNAGGTVTFKDGGNTIGTAQQLLIENGTGIVGQSELQIFFPGGPTAPLTVGSHNITAVYSGDSSFNGSTSSVLAVTVTKGNPGVTLTGQTTIQAGGTQQFMVTVGATGPIEPTGTAQFQVDGVNVGSSVPLFSGQGNASITFPAGGIHNVVAVYSGDATYNSANSNQIAETVTAPFNLTASGLTAQTVAAGGTATYNLSLAGSNGFSGTVALACTGAPAGTTCTVNPANPNVSTAAVPITVTVATTTSARLQRDLFQSTPFVFAGILAIGFCGFRRKTKPALLIVLAMFVISGLVACGGGGGGTVPRPPTVAQLTVTGTSGGLSSSINLTLTITH